MPNPIIQKQRKVLNIGIIGPESTGKSSLAEALAKHFEEPWVPEFGRSYLAKTKGAYEFEDLEKIAKGQQEAVKLAHKEAREMLFIDTDMIMMKVWYQVKYHKVPEDFLEGMEKELCDFYLLLQPDLPWEADPLRENPGLREDLFERYRKELLQYTIAYAEVSGKGEKRLECAIRSLKEGLSLG